MTVTAQIHVPCGLAISREAYHPAFMFANDFDFVLLPLILGPSQGRAAGEAAIRAVEATYDDAWKAGELPSFLRLLTDRVVIITTHKGMLTGRDSVAATFSELFRGMARGSMHDSLVRAIHFVTPDIALVDAEAVIPDFGAGPELLRHAFTDVLVRTLEGWRIDHVRANAFIPRPLSE